MYSGGDTKPAGKSPLDGFKLNFDPFKVTKIEYWEEITPEQMQSETAKGNEALIRVLNGDPESKIVYAGATSPRKTEALKKVAEPLSQTFDNSEFVWSYGKVLSSQPFGNSMIVGRSGAGKTVSIARAVTDVPQSQKPDMRGMFITENGEEFGPMIDSACLAFSKYWTAWPESMSYILRDIQEESISQEEKRDFAIVRDAIRGKLEGANILYRGKYEGVVEDVMISICGIDPGAPLERYYGALRALHRQVDRQQYVAVVKYLASLEAREDEGFIPIPDIMVVWGLSVISNKFVRAREMLGRLAEKQAFIPEKVRSHATYDWPLWAK